MAAVLAAVNAYLEEEQARFASKGRRPSRWLRQGRLEAMKARAACLSRPRRR